jgi:hypothetical protein
MGVDHRLLALGIEPGEALHVRPAPLLRATLPGLLGLWLFALSVPVYQFAVIPRRSGAGRTCREQKIWTPANTIAPQESAMQAG